MTAVVTTTIYDVAHRAGVSHQTVSRVVNDARGVAPGTRARVAAAISELGFVVNPHAQGLRSRHRRDPRATAARPVSVCVVAPDLPRLVRFHETLTAVDAVWVTPDRAELRWSGLTLVLVEGTRAGPAALELGFEVDDVAETCARAAGGASGAVVVRAPATTPRGTVTAVLRDPAGTLVTLSGTAAAEPLARRSA